MTTTYTPSGAPSAETRGSSSAIRNEFSAISQAVNAKGDRAGDTWTGTHNFTGSTVTVPTLNFGATGNAAASVDFVNATVLGVSLPAQTGNGGKLISTDGANASWTDLIKTSNKLADTTDPTKRAAFDASGVTAGQTRKIRIPDRDVVLGGFSNWAIITSTGTWTPPPGITRAEITVIDGGQGGASSPSNPAGPGAGGNASVSIRAVDPTVTYTATIGAGGAGAVAGSGNQGSLGGASSFSGTGLTTITSANGDLKVAGGAGITTANGGYGGGSLYSPIAKTANANGVNFGQGGGGTNTSDPGPNGGPGVIIIRY